MLVHGVPMYSHGTKYGNKIKSRALANNHKNRLRHSTNEETILNTRAQSRIYLSKSVSAPNTKGLN